MRKRLSSVLIAGLFGAALASGPAAAAVLTFEFNTEFSEADSPVGPAPWITVTFTDVGGGVDMLISNSGLTGSEFIQQGIFFNVDPSVSASSLSFSHISGDEAETISKGTNAFKADGDGLYDIKLVYDNAPPADRFDAGDTSKYFISGGGITSASFNFMSAPDGGHGPFLAAAHVGGIGANAEGSGWVAPVPIPEPEAYAMLLAGLGLMGFVARRRSRKQGS